MRRKSSFSASCLHRIAFGLLAFSACLVARPISAQAEPAAGLSQVEGLENWKYQLDLGGYKSGKYNLVVEGVDKAGNVTRAAPMNIYVDPDSDLPRVSIINPTPLERVGGDLNIVGTASDDDGVARVEISVDGGAFVPAEGGEFWSLYLRTGGLEEGRRTIEARAVDVNGLEGPASKVQIDLDLTKPLASVDDPVIGTLVSGQVRLAGSVFDANGVASLEISRDGGSWERVDLKKGDKAGTRKSFSYQVDTRKIADGPHVFRLKSVDGVGSASSDAYLLFADNTKPAIEIARPAEGSAVHGVFSLVGVARDAIGLKRLSYRIGPDQAGEIELTKGDPYFVKELDLGSVKGDSATLTLEAEDAIGNVTRLEKKIRIDRAADKPALRVLGPLATAPTGEKGAAPLPVVRSGEAIWGAIDDDDGVSAFRWSLDGGPQSEVPCSEVFSLAAPEASSGRHVLSLVPVDSNGLAGDPTALAFLLDKGPGRVVFERLSSAEGGRDFIQGIDVAVDGGEFLEGSIEAPNPLVGATYSIAGGEAKALALAKDDKAAVQRFRVAIDRALPYGFAAISVRGRDAFGNDYGERALLYVADYGTAREEPGFRFTDSRLGEDGRISLGSAEGGGAEGGAARPLFGAFYGGELQSLRLEPATDIVAASFEGRVVTIRPVKDGTTAPTRVFGKTTKGREFSSDAMVFATDSTPPSVSISSPAAGAWLKAAPAVAGSVRDSGGGSVGLTWRLLPDGPRAEVAVGADGSFSFQPPELPQGPVSIALEASDRAGNAAASLISFGVDTVAPAVEFLSPEPGASVRGPEGVAASIEDSSGIASVEYAEDGASFAPIEWSGRYFAHRADLAANPKAAYRIIDKAGNATVARPDVAVAEPPKRIAAAASLSVEPGPGEARIEMAGSAGSLKVSALIPGLSESDFLALGTEGEDAAGRFSERLLAQGSLSLKGQASLDLPVKAVSFSRDGGATYSVLASNKEERAAKNTLAFSLAAELGKLAAGADRWTIKVEDFQGGAYYAPLYIYFDSKPPALSIIRPRDASAPSPGPVPLVVLADDEPGLQLAEIAIAAGNAPREPLDAASGSRYFAFMVDPRSGGAKGAAQPITVYAKDAAGNQSQVSYKPAYDAAADAPVLKLGLLEQRPGGIVSGSVSDDDGVPAAGVSIDGGEAAIFPSGSFALALPPLGPGRHELGFLAMIGGSPVAVGKSAITIPVEAPALGDFTIALSSSKDAPAASWAPGGEYELGSSGVLGGRLRSADPKTVVAASFNGGAPVQASLSRSASVPGESRFSVPFPSGLPYGRVSVEIRAMDGSGLEGVERIELHKVLPSPVGADTAEALVFEDARIVQAEGGTSVLLSPGDSLVGRFNGRPIASAAISPASPVLAADFDGTSVFLRAQAEGIARAATIELRTVDGETFSWGPFTASVDSGPPSLELGSPSDGDWVRNEIVVEAAAGDANGIASLEAFIGSGPSAPIAFENPEGGRKAIALDSIGEGAFRIDIVARDRAGRETTLSRYAVKDTTPPELSQVSPAVGESVNGLTTFSGEARDSGRLASLSFVPAAGAPAEEVSGLASFRKDLDLARVSLPLADGGGFVAVDRAGNRSVLAPALVVDVEKDKPVVEIHAPAELEVLRGDFAISGVAYDDDGPAAAYYRIDGGEWNRVEMDGSSFSVAIALASTTDNEHLVEAKAEDIFGVQGEVVARTFRVSKAEPVAAMTAPSISAPVKGRVTLSGASSDANGIGEVAVSVDNRASFARPAGLESWSVDLDTETLSDGIHAVSIRPVDGYDTPGFYATMLSVDNTPPRAQLDLPLDGRMAAGILEVSGRISDNMALASGRIEVARIGSSAPPALAIDVGVERIVQRSIDVSSLEAGAYSVRLVVADKAGNESLASRDVTIAARSPSDAVAIVFPADGERLSGRLRVQGYATAPGAGAVTIMADGAAIASAEPGELGWFSVDIPRGALSDGDHALSAIAVGRDGKSLESPPVRIAWSALGPWVEIGPFASGEYLPYRPFLEGGAGWDAEGPPEGDKAALAAYRKEAESRKIIAVDISLDDGKSFERAKGADKWKFRLETQLYKEGSIHVIARASFADGSTAVRKALFYLDKTLPEVEVLSPAEGGRFNGSLSLAGRAYDENGMASVGVALRKGDKANYQIPSFIQGLYVEAQALGATQWQAGAGLTFFDDNVKLQAIYGMAPETDADGIPQSFYGDVFGGKLVANVAFLPFESLFGADWSFLSASLGLGAGFSYFSETQAGSGLLVGSVFGQVEFPKISFASRSFMKSVSIYSEVQLWVLSSVVDGGFIPKLSFGARIGMF